MFRKVEPIRGTTEELLVQKSWWISATVLNNMFYEYEWLNLIQTKKKKKARGRKKHIEITSSQKKFSFFVKQGDRSLFPVRPESNVVH